METLKANIYSSENVGSCMDDINTKRKIILKDLVYHLENDPEYANSTLWHSTLALSFEHT